MLTRIFSVFILPKIFNYFIYFRSYSEAYFSTSVAF